MKRLIFVVPLCLFLIGCGNHSLGVGTAAPGANQATDGPGENGGSPNPSPGSTITVNPGTTPTPTPTATPTPTPDLCNGFAGDYVGKCVSSAGSKNLKFTVAVVNGACTAQSLVDADSGTVWFQDKALDMTNANQPVATLADAPNGPALTKGDLTLDPNKVFTIKTYNTAGGFGITCKNN